MSSQNKDIDKYDLSHKRVLEAFDLAWDQRNRSWAKYSNFRVGAALYLPEQDLLVGGSNIENVSFGGTICAERSAVVSALSVYGKVPFGFLVVATDIEPPAAPCGMCLQVLVEFCKPDFPIFLTNAKGFYKKSELRNFLPQSFTQF